MRKWLVALVFILWTSSGFCLLVKKAPPKPVEESWQTLRCTEEDRANIYEIVSTVAEKNKLSLLFQQSYLREKGAQIVQVHPLKFLGVIFSDPHLALCMNEIWNDYFKRISFITDLSSALTREADRGKLLPYLNDFAQEIQRPTESMKIYFESRDWDNFLLWLIQF